MALSILFESSELPKARISSSLSLSVSLMQLLLPEDQQFAFAKPPLSSDSKP